ncbi:TatD family [Fusarium flagelliforme]|uniref:Cut9 interacting protein scn1 n=1 Tax=Fusarium flagelliforme TaxID=2675880 RepID=A0A395MP10_9HYPO|nr:TatD family [Fusarium flagelliforme]KAH7189267.1 TatD family [Fusarium flagelliforme]RFN49285.1 cut9 interacting protein scn1 [Fusarium flagelliforme]
MCQHTHNYDEQPVPVTGDQFPWHLPICDAHCHPTDTMDSIQDIPSMRAAALTIMSTRAQDQDLVADVASNHNKDLKQLFQDNSGECNACVVPSFGWHPWFSHLLYDDSADTPTYQPAGSGSGSGSGPSSGPGPASDHDSNSDSDSDSDAAAKQAHYNAVLQPEPSPEFVASLPTPVAVSAFLKETESRLSANPHALVGEIGVDKAFRLPEPWNPSEHAERDSTLTAGGREGRRLSPHRVRIEHQREILAAQLRLAAKTRRAVSVHGVQAHGVLHDTLAATWKGHEREYISRRKRRLVAKGAEDFSDEEDDDSENPYPPRICLHSFSANVEVLKQYLNPTIPARIFVSLSTAVNLSTDASSAKTDEVLRALPDDSILVESDLHIAGEHMDQALENMYRHVCEVKGWELEEGIKKIAKNYEEFILGR